MQGRAILHLPAGVWDIHGELAGMRVVQTARVHLKGGEDATVHVSIDMVAPAGSVTVFPHGD